MPPLILSRFKSEEDDSAEADTTKTNVIKKEIPEHYIEVQPKIETIEYIPIPPPSEPIIIIDSDTKEEVEYMPTPPLSPPIIIDDCDTKLDEECIPIPPPSEPIIVIDCDSKEEEECIHTPPPSEPITTADCATKEEKKYPKKRSDSIPANRRPQLPMAIRVHRYLMSKDPYTLSKKELSSLNWAETVIVHRFLKRARETSNSKDELPVKVMNPFAKNASAKLTKQVKSDQLIPNSLSNEVRSEQLIGNSLSNEVKSEQLIPNSLSNEVRSEQLIGNSLSNEVKSEQLIPNSLSNEVRSEQLIPNSLSNEVRSEQLIPTSLKLEIVDYGSLNKKYTYERGKLIEKAFNKAVCHLILSQPLIPKPRFGLTTWRHGVLVLDCKDTNSFNFARATINKLVPWQDAKLRAIPLTTDTQTYIGRFDVRDIGVKTMDVIRVLQSQNPNINMRNWKVVEEKPSFQPGFRAYFVSISPPPPTFLQNNLTILFGASEVPLEWIKKENTS